MGWLKFTRTEENVKWGRGKRKGDEKAKDEYERILTD